MLSEDAIAAWFRVLGYGAIDAPLWFVGMEPGGPVAEGPPDPGVTARVVGSDEVLFDPMPDPRSTGSAAWRRPVQIVRALWEPDTPFEVASSRAWSRMMCANLAPLPRPGQSVPHLGIPESDYTARVRLERVPLLHRLFRTLPQLRVMVVHGHSAWRRYGVREVFNTDEQPWATIEAPHPMPVLECGDRRLVLAPSFTRGVHVTNADRAALVAHLARWKDRDGDWGD
ncbi:hypothetical protein [Dyella psychrodurans]|uniref:Uracil-DNA glycosylase n=1 Tax=Dyella psychrodurans TaxID=1927960 RepID=A0A370XC51_9GAMM|nr:hypothetical protein [Dyella psychrodurans]RDS85882.1 hypothetical protein DWU99_00990 [Dyella psychrodurans]